jgi:hypothetical protein
MPFEITAEKQPSVAVEPFRLKWYEFDQNNSGGRYTEDDNNAQLVCIQAPNAEEANRIMRDRLDLNYCDCCGERYSSIWSDAEGSPVPSYGGQPLPEADSWRSTTSVRLHYYDGRIVSGELTKKPAPEIHKRIPL